MATKNQIRAALRKKKRAGLLPPQVCGNERCKVDLSDPNVPAEHAMYREMFGLAVERIVEHKAGRLPQAVWECPVCGWQSKGKHPVADTSRFR